MAFPAFSWILCNLCPSLISFCGLKCMIHVYAAETLSLNLYFFPLWYDYKYKVYFLFKNTFWMIILKCQLKSQFLWKSKGSTLREGGSDQDCWRAEPAAACWVSSKCRAFRACTLAKVVMPDHRVHLSSA